MKYLYLFKQTKIQLFIIAFLTTLAYSNIFQNEFVIDDKTFFVEWEGLHKISNLPQLFTGSGLPGGSHIGYRPVRTVLMLFSYQIFGINPFGYHVISLLGHIICTVLIFFITSQIILKVNGVNGIKGQVLSIKRPSFGGRGKNKNSLNTYPMILIPFLTALLFGLHPIHTEAVTFITAGFDTWGIVFLLGSFLLYIKSKAAKSKSYYIASIILAILAFFTYEMTLVLPLLIILYDWCFRKLQFKRYLPFILGSLGYLFIRFSLLNIYSRPEYANFSIYFIFLTALKSFIRYISLLILPINLSLDQIVEGDIYAFIEPAGLLEKLEQESFLSFNNISAIFLMILLILAVFKLHKKLPQISFAVGWFLVCFLPISNIVFLGVIMQERYVYLASFGYCLLLGYGLFWILSYPFTKIFNFQFSIFNEKFKFKISNSKLVVGYLLLVTYLALFYGVRTYIRNFDWKDDIALSKAVSESSPNNFKEHYYLGARYATKSEFELAKKAYLKSISVNPNYFPPYFHLGHIKVLEGDKNGAIMYYQKVLELDPDFTPAKNMLDNLSK